MKNKTTVFELRESILLLEIKKTNEMLLLKEQFKVSLENLKPVNLIKNTILDLAKSPDFKGDVLTTTLSLAAGYLSKKVIIGETHNPLKQLLGTLLQVGVTSLVSKNVDGIKSVASAVIKNLFSKKETKTENSFSDNV